MDPLLPSSVENLHKELQALPGIGERSAWRMVQYVLAHIPAYPQRLQQALEALENFSLCPVCHFWSENQQPCALCKDPSRNEPILCLVAKPSDILPLEKTQVFRGKYHVLGGLLDPLRGIGEKDLHLTTLLPRIQNGAFEEVLFALGTSLEAETTQYYIAEFLRPYNLRLTYLPSGVPFGSEIEYVDAFTLARSVKNRQVLS
ncbi:MAG: recombination mediator RecR [Bacteroidia bacterium]